jgi:hypothetical protein
MRATFVMGAEQTLGAVAAKLRENSAGLVPVVEAFLLRGVVTETSLAKALAEGHVETDGIEVAFMAEPPVVRLYESGAEALRAFDRYRAGSLVVVDDDYRVLGILRASDLVDPPNTTNRPPLIGGMATPFGVYLTSGTAFGGPRGLALVSTGITLFSLLSGATLVSFWLLNWFVHLGMAAKAADLVTTIIQFGLFVACFRLLPISGIHAAEHMVVHAIERGEPLIPSVVKRMPRVHPRCGTNLAVGATLFLSIATTPALPGGGPRELLALVATLLLWKRLGGLVQYWVTTRPPTSKQIEMGISSAKELLENQAKVQRTQVSFGHRLWNSGMFHVMAGSILVATVLGGLAVLFPQWHLPF